MKRLKRRRSLRASCSEKFVDAQSCPWVGFLAKELWEWFLVLARSGFLSLELRESDLGAIRFQLVSVSREGIQERTRLILNSEFRINIVGNSDPPLRKLTTKQENFCGRLKPLDSEATLFTRRCC
jgi:hypothetical protein